LPQPVVATSLAPIFTGVPVRSLEEPIGDEGRSLELELERHRELVEHAVEEAESLELSRAMLEVVVKRHGRRVEIHCVCHAFRSGHRLGILMLAGR
jgi:hypothetical protein